MSSPLSSSRSGGGERGGERGMQRNVRDKVAYGDDRLGSPHSEEQNYRQRKQQKKYRPRPEDNEEGLPFSSSWDNDRRGDGGARHHGSSDERSRSLTPAMMVDEDDGGWLLDEEEVRMQRRRGGASRSERGQWSNGGGRNRGNTGIRERQREDVNVCGQNDIIIMLYMYISERVVNPTLP